MMQTLPLKSFYRKVSMNHTRRVTINNQTKEEDKAMPWRTQWAPLKVEDLLVKDSIDQGVSSVDLRGLPQILDRGSLVSIHQGVEDLEQNHYPNKTWSQLQRYLTKNRTVAATKYRWLPVCTWFWLCSFSSRWSIWRGWSLNESQHTAAWQP